MKDIQLSSISKGFCDMRNIKETYTRDDFSKDLPILTTYSLENLHVDKASKDLVYDAILSNVVFKDLNTIVMFGDNKNLNDKYKDFKIVKLPKQDKIYFDSLYKYVM